MSAVSAVGRGEPRCLVAQTQADGKSFMATTVIPTAYYSQDKIFVALNDIMTRIQIRSLFLSQYTVIQYSKKFQQFDKSPRVD